MSWRIGVDIGGTFTDVAVVNEADGRIGVVKVSTTPRDFGEGVVTALRQALEAHVIAPGEVSLLSHATTVVTNALLEGKGARIGLVTTRGFRDVLELRRSARADLYDLFQDPPSVLVPRRWRMEVTERVDAQGEIVTPLAEGELDVVIDIVREQRLEAVAVCLLYSFLNDRHEQAIGRRLRAALPDIPVFLSSEVLPEIREFERTSTTAVCAYVGPLLRSYLERLQAAVSEMGLPALHVMGSSGGVFGVAEGLKMPAMAVESGPAAGVIAAALVGRQLGRPNLMSFDMGGTTAKASLIANGEIHTTAEYEVGGSGNVNRWLHGTGHPIRVPVIDLAEVSAGGGSIAWIDPGGALRVGPRSAGADPGPVAYGRGGTEPTVTDADILLGYLDPAALLGGALPIDRNAAAEAVARHIGDPLGQSVTEAAAGILAVVNAGMAEALRIVSVERGHDAREFALVAFGGAGPVHAAFLAAELDIPEVIVPPAPGAFSALGLVATDLRRDWSRTLYTDLAAADLAVISAIYAEMEADADRMLREAGIAEADRELARAADLRYRRQAYELTVPIPDVPGQGGGRAITRETIEALAASFHERHRQTYGHDSPGETVHLVNVRLTALGRLKGLTVTQATAGTAARPKGRRNAWFRQTGFAACDVWAREDLSAGAALPGPAIVEAMDTTVIVPPGWTASVEAQGFLVMRRAA